MRPLTVLRLLLLTVLILRLNAFSFGQAGQKVKVKDPIVQIADFRGKGFDTAGKAALQASKKDVAVVLVCGAQQILIDETEAAIKGLIRDGYTRVAMIIADPHPTPANNPFVAVIAGGDNPSYMTGVSAHAQYAVDLYRSVKSAYELFIQSKGKN